MKFPYAMSDFGAIRREGYFYQDRSDRIARLEEAGRQLIFIRPRRFGKTLLLSMLEHYYDVRHAREFDALFGKLAIGQHPTPARNTFLVMRWDFSLVAAHGSVEEIKTALHRHVNDRIIRFQHNHGERLPVAIDIDPVNAVSSWESTLTAVAQTPYPLYLLIDEYDNFANEVLMAGRRQADYERLLQGEGALKTLFKAIKGSLRGQDRVFITGVSPVVLSDMTSGYNVGEDIYLKAEFNDLCGFTEAEVIGMLEQLSSQRPAQRSTQRPGHLADRPWSPAEALELMRTFYNGYRFATRAAERLYNPTLSLYFLKNLHTECRYPDQMLDENMAMDRGKLAYIAELPHGEELVAEALNGETGIRIPELARRFGVADVLTTTKDQPFMASLLYYFGVLTLTGQTDFLEAILNIPNLVARSLYVERLQARWLTTYEDRNNLPQLRKQVFQTGDLTPLVAFIEKRYFPILSNRDYRWSNELMVKLAFLTLLFDDRLYMMVSETEMEHGYVDLSLIRRLDRRTVPALDLLIEFKYVSLPQTKLTGAQLREKPMTELAALPAVAAELEAAAEQARRYGGALAERYGLKDLRLYAVVGLGLERVVWQPLALAGEAGAAKINRQASHTEHSHL
jgi:hypothetical protein